VLGLVLLAALLAFAGSHGAIVAALARRGEWRRAALALIFLPLAPYWAWRAGMRARVSVWIAALVVYALGVAVSAT
jgi:hypothetical protein